MPEQPVIQEPHSVAAVTPAHGEDALNAIRALGYSMDGISAEEWTNICNFPVEKFNWRNPVTHEKLYPHQLPLSNPHVTTTTTTSTTSTTSTTGGVTTTRPTTQGTAVTTEPRFFAKRRPQSVDEQPKLLEETPHSPKSPRE